MFLALDLGNTSIKAGVFEQGNLVFHSHLDHPPVATIKTYQAWLKPMFEKYQIKEIGLASVKPALRHLIVKALAQLTTYQPRFITRKDYPKFTIRINQPDELGIDLIVDGVAAQALYQSEAIIIDLGTATKVMAIHDRGFEGVAIAPGILTSFKALNQNAALIQTMNITKPKEVFGKNTEQALASGIILGQVHMIEGLIKQGMNAFHRQNPTIVLTGGYAPLLLPYFSLKLVHEPNLSLKGIQLCQR
ncbi:MAG: type III pantothenate kinase [Bacilli bacterium]